MNRGFVCSISGHHVWAWKRDDGQTWDVWMDHGKLGQRKVGQIVGTKRIALAVCCAFAEAPRLPTVMALPD